MNHAFRQFSMGAVAIAIMQVASAQVSMTNIVPMSLADQGTEIRVMFNGLPPQPQAYQLEQPSRLILDFDKAQQNLNKHQFLYQLMKHHQLMLQLMISVHV
jgi:type IV pilus assembly protein PilQ